MNFINVNTTQNGNRPTSNANYIGLVYSNVLNSSLSFYLPLTGGILSSNLGIGNSISSLNNLNILNVNSFIVASSNITACSNMITSNINSISINNAGVLTTSTITQLNKNPITLRGLITSESNISFNQNNDILSLPVINASLMGGSGSRIIFKAAKNISSLPDAIGLNTDTLWISSSNLLFYINNENRVTINSNGVIITSNQINQLNPGVNNFFMGKVGIATSTESSYNLNVNGSLNATSITINGSSISSSISDVITNSSNYASNISNVLLTNYNSLNTTTNTNISNYALNISNILTTRDAANLTSSSNYSLNISNIIIANNSNFTLGTATNTSNYALNISNILTTRDAANLTSSSNYSLNISNILKANIDANNTTTNTTINTAIGNTSNYALNISNILTTRDAANLTSSSNYSLNISNILKANIDANNTTTNTTINTAIGNTSNYALNISNILKANIDANNRTTNTAIGNTSNYATNISNIIATNYLLKSGGTMTGNLTTTDNVGIGMTNPFAMLNLGTPAVESEGTLVISRKAAFGFRNFRFGYDNSFNFCMGDFGDSISNNIWNSNQFNIRYNSGNVGIGTSGQSYKLYVNGTTYLNNNTTINGTCTATTFSGSGASLTSIPYSNITELPATFPPTMTNIYTKTETNTLLNAKEATLTFNSPLTRTTNTIGLNQSLISYNNLADRPNLNLYLLKSGGAMTGQITGITTLNGTTGIFGTIETTNNTNQAIPALGVAGGVGDKYIIQAGTATTYPYSIGFETNSLWMSSPNTIKLYNNGVNSILINSSGNVGIGTTNPGTNRLNVNGTTYLNNNTTINGTCTATTFSGSGASLTSIPYSNITELPATFPPTMTNIYTKTETNTLLNAKEATLTFNSPLTRTTNTIGLNQSLISYNNLADRPNLNLYLLKSGGAMTGQITGITTLNGTTGIFGTIETTNNTNQAIPALGVAGGVGDKYIIQAGTATTYPYSIGFETNSLWMSSPNTIKLYNNGVNSILINSSGNVGIGTTNPGTNRLNVNGTTFLGGNTNINGIANINNGSPSAVPNNYMQSGSLTIGGTNANYGGGTNWNANTAGLLMECSDNTEIAVHDALTRVASLMYFEGANNRITIGRNMGWGAISSVVINGNVGINNPTPLGTLSIGRPDVESDGSLVISRNSSGNRNFKIGYDSSFNMCIGDFGGATSGNTWRSTDFNIKWDTGNIGIGIASQSQKLYVNGSTYINDATTINGNLTLAGTSSYLKVNGYYYESSGYTRVYMTGQGYLSVIDPSASVPVSIKTSSAIWAGTHLHYTSDIRIKTEINNIIDDSALRKILAIEPKTYKYIDKITRSNNVVYGFIAQQIREIIPEAVSLEKEVIPNIFKICNCENDEIILDNNIISSNLSINDKIDIYDINNNKKQYKIVNILDNKIKINESINSSNCFVYGKEVDDFHTLNKDYIFTLNVCATQELHRIIQGLQTIIQNQQNQINLIKSHLDL